MNANKQIVYFKLIFSVYTVNYTYFGLQASPAAVDMLQFEMSVMFIPYFMIDSWLQGSSLLRDLPIIINRSHAFRWDRRSMHCLTNVEVFFFFFVQNTHLLILHPLPVKPVCPARTLHDALKASNRRLILILIKTVTVRTRNTH